MERVFGLDALRALAIIFVLVSHGRYFLLQHVPSLNFLSIFGFLGVEFFFVLSGFLIGGIVLKTLDKEPTLRTLTIFWKRRWFRTLPNYFLFLALNCLFITILNKNLIVDWKYLLFMQNFAWEMPSLFPESWSLTVEEWFYIIFPTIAFASILLTCRLKYSILGTSIFILMSVTIIRFVYVLDNNPLWDAGVRKVMFLRLDALMYGVLGASLKYFYLDRWINSKKVAATLGTIALVVAVAGFYSFEKDNSIFTRTLLFSVTSFGVLCFLPLLDAWKTEKSTLFSRAVIATSLWSYSLYLSNYLMYNILTITTKGISKNIYLSVSILTVWFIATFVISRAVYLYFEKPVMDLRDLSFFNARVKIHSE